MRALTSPPQTSHIAESQRSLQLIESRVAMVLDDTRCLLSNGRQASRAVSCLVQLQAGDGVLVSQPEEGVCYVLHILERNHAEERGLVAISVPGATKLSFRQEHIGIHATEMIELMSARDIGLTAATGNLSFNARNLFATVSESLVQQSRHFIGKAGQYLLEVRHLLKLHGQDALITADRDIKADAERISMG